MKNSCEIAEHPHPLAIGCIDESGTTKSGQETVGVGRQYNGTGEWITLRRLLRVSFGRCSIESCFREGKEELGLDHYEVRGWRCVHRHFYVTQLSHLFCVRQKYDDASDEEAARISVELVRSAMNVYLNAADLSVPERKKRFEDELNKQQYDQRRNRHARKSHVKPRLAKLADLGIDVSRIKSCLPDTG